MKQKARFEKFVNVDYIVVGYRSMNGQYISIALKKAISVDICYTAWVVIAIVLT